MLSNSKTSQEKSPSNKTLVVAINVQLFCLYKKPGEGGRLEYKCIEPTFLEELCSALHKHATQKGLDIEFLYIFFQNRPSASHIPKQKAHEEIIETALNLRNTSGLTVKFADTRANEKQGAKGLLTYLTNHSSETPHLLYLTSTKRLKGSDKGKRKEFYIFDHEEEAKVVSSAWPTKLLGLENDNPALTALAHADDTERLEEKMKEALYQLIERGRAFIDAVHIPAQPLPKEWPRPLDTARSSIASDYEEGAEATRQFPDSDSCTFLGRLGRPGRRLRIESIPEEKESSTSPNPMSPASTG